MKMLIFSALVLGSIAYLVATQSDLLQAWATEDSVVVSETETLTRPADASAERKAASEIMQDLQVSVSALKAELAALQEAKMPTENGSVEKEIPLKLTPDVQAKTSLAQRQIIPDPAPVSPYMQAAERSQALMDLVHRMEMKAAGY
jgi:hypothetical protein